jgi:hypothetical protein
MDIAIQVVWAIGLTGALVATLVILKEVVLVLRTLRHIEELAEITRRAAEGIGRNVDVGTALDGLEGRARRLHDNSLGIAGARARIEPTVEAAARRAA